VPKRSVFGDIFEVGCAKQSGLAKHPNRFHQFQTGDRQRVTALEKGKFGRFEDIVDLTPTELRPITNRLREIILSVDPDSCVVIRIGDRSATFGIGPKKMSEGYAHILPYKDWINLGFYKGVDIEDPSGLLEGTGSKMRHVKIRSIEDCENPAIVDLILCALAERRNALQQN